MHVAGKPGEEEEKVGEEYKERVAEEIGEAGKKKVVAGNAQLDSKRKEED